MASAFGFSFDFADLPPDYWLSPIFFSWLFASQAACRFID